MIATLTGYAQTRLTGAQVSWKNECGKVTFKLKSFPDTCIKYTTSITSWQKWLILEIHDTVFTRTLDTGYYTFEFLFWNKCLHNTNIDTFISYYKVHIGCDSTTAGLKNTTKEANIRVIGYYDMTGKKIDYMELNIPYIVIYSNGKRQKIVRTK